MKKIVTLFAGLVVSLSLAAEINTDNNNIIYIKNEMIKAVDNSADLYAVKSNNHKLELLHTIVKDYMEAEQLVEKYITDMKW